MQDGGVTVQKFRIADSVQEAEDIAKNFSKPFEQLFDLGPKGWFKIRFIRFM